MRRPRPSYAYRQRTQDIVQGSLDPWQLQSRDPREWSHRMLNRIVSVADALDEEITYLERMFMPDSMDLTEEFVVYRAEPSCALAELYISGEPASSLLPTAASIDEFIAGLPNLLVPLDYSGEYPEGTISAVPHGQHAFTVLSESGEIGTYLDGEYTATDVSPAAAVVTLTLDLDRTRPVYTITEEVEYGSITLTTPSGELVPCQILYAEDATGIWEQSLDADGDGVIWLRELALLNEAYGKSVADYGIDEWPMVSWADIDEDGYIGPIDYRRASSAYPSLVPGVYAAIDIGDSVAGRFLLNYTPKTEHRSVLTRNPDLPVLMDTCPLVDTDVTYDEHTGIYYRLSPYGILRACTYNHQRESIEGDVLIYTPFWSPSGEYLSLDCRDGYLFTLVRNEDAYRVYYADIWQEQVEHLSGCMEVEGSGEFTYLRLSDDGLVVLGDLEHYRYYRPVRDLCCEVNGVAYVNRRRTLSDADGNVRTLVPHYLFNSFDSYLYTYGIERPPGADNLRMREIIYDLYANGQGNDAIGMCSGISRELGVVPGPIVPSGAYLLLPAPVGSLASMTVNGEIPVLVSGDPWLVSGSFGAFYLDAQVVIPTEEVLGTTITLAGSFLDGNGDAVESSYTVSFPAGTYQRQIAVRTHADGDFLSGESYLLSGEPSDEFVALVDGIEADNPSTYANAIVNVTSFDVYRVSEQPVLATRYDPAIVPSGSCEVSL